jgi:hypothetical protein
MRLTLYVVNKCVLLCNDAMSLPFRYRSSALFKSPSSLNWVSSCDHLLRVRRSIGLIMWRLMCNDVYRSTALSISSFLHVVAILLSFYTYSLSILYFITTMRIFISSSYFIFICIFIVILLAVVIILSSHIIITIGMSLYLFTY